MLGLHLLVQVVQVVQVVLVSPGWLLRPGNPKQLTAECQGPGTPWTISMARL